MAKKIISILLIMVMALSVVACANNSDEAKTENKTEEEKVENKESDNKEETKEATSSEQYKVGITFSDLGNPVWAELVREAESYGTNKNMEITYVDAQSDTSKQVTQIENFIQNEVDAIIICAVEANSVADVTKKAMDQGIKVIAYTQVLENADAQHLVDPYNTGYACGQRAAKWINEKYPDEKNIKWALMDLPTFPEIIERANGIIAGVEENAENTELVATASALTSEEGLKNAENFLQAHPDLKFICCIGGGGSVGGNEGIKSSGITDFESIGLFGIDATEQEILNIINGDPQKSSVSLGGGKEHGRILIDITENLLLGKAQEEIVYMPIRVIDSTNAQEYYDEVYGGK